ncbi:MAG TPA: O-antigen ligase family protein [Solirubrobacterales bacterium]|nr:O-antigen ligase family protein [Solirubrobacterales bacterium]
MSELLASVGVLAAAGAAAGAILLPPGRTRAAMMLVALALFPVLILGDQWHSRAIADLRDSTGRMVALGALALAASAALAFAFRRWPMLLPLAIVAALPFRVPLQAGGDTANLLVPLYLVIAGGVLASAVRDWRGRPAGPVAAGDPPPPAVAKASSRAVPPTAPPAGRALVWLPRILAAVVGLYAVGVLYSEDFSKGLQDVCFFFVPFSLVYGLLRDVSWDRKLLVLVLWVVALEAVAFVVVGSVEYLSRSLFWNDQVIRSNEFHTYFRVNSVFWDPNIYGRYLALVAVLAMSALMWARERRDLALLTALVAIVWIGLFPTFSQSSFVALLGGLAVLAALKWSLRWTLAAVAGLAVLGVLVVLLAGGSSKLSPNRINIDTSGRANLVSGGIHLFAQRPVYGYGSGSFPKAYRQHVKTKEVPVSVSHTEPITIAAEQGLAGLLLYAALVLTALWTMASGVRSSLSRISASRAGGAVGGTAPEDALATAGGGGSPAATGPARQLAIARAAILATFTALLVHTMAYAGFYEDPITWVLLAMGVSLAAAQQRRVEPCPDTSAA